VVRPEKAPHSGLSTIDTAAPTPVTRESTACLWSGERPKDKVFVLTTLYGVCTVVTAFLGGLWSDRAGKRKAFVIGSGLIIAGALLLLAFVHTAPAAFAGAIVLGIGFGIYSAVDFAMITQVLPGATDRAKDLGVINIANTLPQVLAPGAAAGCSPWASATPACTPWRPRAAADRRAPGCR
jgi:MFS family permease